jgi:hypothetical protein
MHKLMKKQTKGLLLTSGVIAVLLVSVAIGVSANQDFRSLIANAIAERISPQVVEALGLGQDLGLSVPDVANSGLTNVRISGELIQRDSNDVDIHSLWERVSLDAADGEFRGSITNSTDSEIIMDNLRIFIDGTVTSTFDLGIFVSSTAIASLSYNMTQSAAAYGDEHVVLVAERIATSTVDTIIDNIEMAGVSASSSVRIPDDEYLNILMKNPYVAGCTNAYGCNVSSTNRGFDVEVWAHFIW